MNALMSSEICRICGERRNKFYKIEGVMRNVIFELISEISNSQIIDDFRLTKSICCDCSAKLQNAKICLDTLKRSHANLKDSKNKLKDFHFQCRACLGAIKKNFAINIYAVSMKIGKCLADVIREIEKGSNFLKPATFVCRSCSSMLSSFASLKSTIISSNTKFMKEISSLQDPLMQVEIKNEPEIEIYDEGELQILTHQDIIIKVDRSDNPVINITNESHPTNVRNLLNKFKCLQPDCELNFFTKVERDYHMKVDSHLPDDEGPKLGIERKRRLMTAGVSSKRLKIERENSDSETESENETKQLDLINIKKESLLTIDENSERLNDDQILCKSCNRIVSSFHYQNHLKSKFHSFFLEFPEHRSKKIKRQQKLTEYQILTKMKIFCDICNVSVTADYWKNHLKLKKHLFNLENPDLKPKKRKPKASRHNFDEDVLIKGDQTPKAMICDYCRRRFYKKSLLEIHLKRHAKSFRIFKCYFCNEKFFTSSGMISHRREYHANENGLYECECGTNFKKFELFLRHKSKKGHSKKDYDDQKRTHKVDNSLSTSLSCNDFGKSLKSIKKLQFHRNIEHLPFMTCDLCGNETQSKAKLCRHMKVHFSKNKRNLVCEYCGIGCKYQCHLNRHLANVHGIGKSSKNERFYCDRDKCEKSYVERKDLINHIKYFHEGVVKQHKYFCNVCGLKFYKLNKCNKHMQSRAHMKRKQR